MHLFMVIPSTWRLGGYGLTCSVVRRSHIDVYRPMYLISAPRSIWEQICLPCHSVCKSVEREGWSQTATIFKSRTGHGPAKPSHNALLCRYTNPSKQIILQNPMATLSDTLVTLNRCLGVMTVVCSFLVLVWGPHASVQSLVLLLLNFAAHTRRHAHGDRIIWVPSLEQMFHQTFLYLLN